MIDQVVEVRAFFMKKMSSFCMAHTHETKFRLLELYSGIGGMRYALEAAGILYDIVAAIDINPIVNKIYEHNFSSVGHYQKNILSLTVSEVEDMKLDIITMSPPCQPFTRVGLKKDVQDTRSSSFIHMLEIIKKLKKKPSYIILENVQGFEKSVAKDFLVQTIRSCQYSYQEFLLSPLNFGIPNSRLRYYLIAKLIDVPVCFQEISGVPLDMPVTDVRWRYQCHVCRDRKNVEVSACPIAHFLEEKSNSCMDAYKVPDSILLKYWSVFDMVTSESYNSCCFTKAYHRYAQGTGSVLLQEDPHKADRIFKQVVDCDDPETCLTLLKSVGLRYFTPKEIANLMCFPSHFGFPNTITIRQMYKSLGNSINVYVVSCLLQMLFQDKKLPFSNVSVERVVCESSCS